MSKRSETIRNLFATSPTAELSADNARAALPRVASGSIRSLQNTFSDVERENQELRDRMAASQAILDLDPHLIEPSPIRDRFEDQDPASFETLKLSIQTRGQEVPVLVRPNDGRQGFFQAAYGHRRVRAARDLGITVRAVVRPMSDEELAVAQGVENSAREDLTFIERAVFAMRLEDLGHSRLVVQEALSIDRAEVSKLIAVARGLPMKLIHMIGRAPKAGRPRWQLLVEALQKPAAVERSLSAADDPLFQFKSSDERFVSVLATALAKEESGEDLGVKVRPLLEAGGLQIATVAQTEKQVRIAFDRRLHADFAAFVESRLPELFKTYSSKQAS